MAKQINELEKIIESSDLREKASENVSFLKVEKPSKLLHSMIDKEIKKVRSEEMLYENELLPVKSFAIGNNILSLEENNQGNIPKVEIEPNKDEIKVSSVESICEGKSKKDFYFRILIKLELKKYVPEQVFVFVLKGKNNQILIFVFIVFIYFI